MALHAPPLASQRCHAKASASGWTPVQVPGVALRVLPVSGVPAIAGGAVMAGAPTGAAATSAEAGDVAVATPAAFFAVTTTRRVEPTAAVPAVYAWLVPLFRATHVAPLASQRCQA